MSALSIQPTFPTFTDSDGTGLDDGYIWIGVAGSDPISTPLTTYWDAALTSVVTQPIRTRGGYPLNAGAIGRLYVNSNYSIKVRNRNGFDLYSSLTATERYNDVVVQVDASDVTYTPAGTGAVATTVQTKLRESVSVKDFGAVGDGVADDGAAINACFAASTVNSVYFPAGTYLTSVQIVNNGKSAKGEGWQKSSIKASSAITSVFKFSGQNQVVQGISFNANSLADYGVIMQGCNSSMLTSYGVENAKIDGVYFPTSGNNNCASIVDGLIRYCGTTYSTGTASVSAGGTVVTITGAADLTTLGFRTGGVDFLKVGTTQRAREITAITTNTVTVYPAFDSAETSVAYSLRKGSGIHVDTNADNSREKLMQNTIQQCAVAGIDQTPLYGASCFGNTIELCEFGHIIGRRSYSSATRGSEDFGGYYEVNPSGNFLFGGAFGCDVISPNSDIDLGSFVFQPNQGGIRIRYDKYDLSEAFSSYVNIMAPTPDVNTTNMVIGAQDNVVTLPDIPAQTQYGAGTKYAWHVRLLVFAKSGKTTTIKSSTKVNGVTGSTGISVTGDYRTYDCWYTGDTNYGWVVAGVNQPTSFNGDSGGGIAVNGVYTYTVTGVDCLNGKVSVTAWGGGENVAADAYLVGYSVTNRTTTGCTVNIKNLGSAIQTLKTCIVVTP